MPDKETIERAREDKRRGRAASTQAGEFVKEEMDHIREGKHGARSTAAMKAVRTKGPRGRSMAARKAARTRARRIA